MRLPEQRLWDRLSSLMSGRWVATRVENRVEKSMPDLFFSHHEVHGWIELKAYRQPTRGTTKFKISNWTAGQQAWALRFAEALTPVWLVIHFDRTNEIFVLGAHDALAANNKLSVDQFRIKYGHQALGWNVRDAKMMIDLLQQAWFNSCVTAAMAPPVLRVVPSISIPR